MKAELNRMDEGGYFIVIYGDKEFALQLPYTGDSINYLIDNDGEWIDIPEEVESEMLEAIEQITKEYSNSWLSIASIIETLDFEWEWDYCGNKKYAVAIDEDGTEHCFVENPMSDYYNKMIYDLVSCDQEDFDMGIDTECFKRIKEKLSSEAER